MFDDFFDMLENLTDDEWNTKVDENWSVKDVVAHLVGWEKECALQIPIIWQSQKRPWFLEAYDDYEFNRRSIIEYKDMQPNQLLQEWYIWQDKSQEEIDKIGEDNLKSQPTLFGWLFESEISSDETNLGHYEEHITQINSALHR